MNEDKYAILKESMMNHIMSIPFDDRSQLIREVMMSYHLRNPHPIKELKYYDYIALCDHCNKDILNVIYTDCHGCDKIYHYECYVKLQIEKENSK